MAPRAIQRDRLGHPFELVAAGERPIEAVRRAVADLLRAEDAAGSRDSGHTAREVDRMPVEVAGAKQCRTERHARAKAR